VGKFSFPLRNKPLRKNVSPEKAVAGIGHIKFFEDHMRRADNDYQYLNHY
jgi:hypothetical protein